MDDNEKKRYCLEKIEKILKSNITSLSAYTDMPQPPLSDELLTNVLVLDEKNYDYAYLTEKYGEWIEMLTAEQRNHYDYIIEAMVKDEGGVFFVYGFGGTGKIFL